METITADRWLTRQDLADRYSLPVKTPAQRAATGIGHRMQSSVGTSPDFLSDVINWERVVRQTNARLGMTAARSTSSQVVVLCSTD
jgi:hypothetical protein